MFLADGVRGGCRSLPIDSDFRRTYNDYYWAGLDKSAAAVINVCLQKESCDGTIFSTMRG